MAKSSPYYYNDKMYNPKFEIIYEWRHICTLKAKVFKFHTDYEIIFRQEDFSYMKHLPDELFLYILSFIII